MMRGGLGWWWCGEAGAVVDVLAGEVGNEKVKEGRGQSVYTSQLIHF